jgi:hypothetical protein
MAPKVLAPVCVAGGNSETSFLQEEKTTNENKVSTKAFIVLNFM